jgi:hypothetical protein
MTDEIVLTLPDERAFFNVAHLVVGGLAVRLNLTFENLEDLQVALEGLLPRAKGEVTVRLRLEEGAVSVNVGPFACDPLRAELEADDRERVGLRRVLDTVADGVEVVQGEGGCWVRLKKRVEPLREERES